MTNRNECKRMRQLLVSPIRNEMCLLISPQDEARLCIQGKKKRDICWCFFVEKQSREGTTVQVMVCKSQSYSGAERISNKKTRKKGFYYSFSHLSERKSFLLLSKAFSQPILFIIFIVHWTRVSANAMLPILTLIYWLLHRSSCAHKRKVLRIFLCTYNSSLTHHIIHYIILSQVHCICVGFL